MSLENIERSLDFIESHLSEELKAAEIAAHAGFSEWHFQRVFKATLGDTLKVYIRRRRLAEAGKTISCTDQGLLEIAMTYGFESQESFTRAFKKEYGMTPGAVRTQKMTEKRFYGRARVTPEYLKHLCGGMTMEPKIIELEEMTIAGKADHFISVLSPDANNFEVIPSLWGKFVPERQKLKRKNQDDWGICICLDEKKAGRPGECWYMAGCEIENGSELPDGFEKTIVPKGKYAVFTHKGSLDKLGMTYKYIFGSWIHTSKNQLREAPDLELYDERFLPGRDDSELDIYIPII